MTKSEIFFVRFLLIIAAATPLQQVFAGIPVIDGLNISQSTISAIQNVAAVTKQIEQYKTQLEQ